MIVLRFVIVFSCSVFPNQINIHLISDIRVSELTIMHSGFTEKENNLAQFNISGIYYYQKWLLQCPSISPTQSLPYCGDTFSLQCLHTSLYSVVLPRPAVDTDRCSPWQVTNYWPLLAKLPPCNTGMSQYLCHGLDHVVRPSIGATYSSKVKFLGL